MRQFRELDAREREEYGSLVNNPWLLPDEERSVEEVADSPELYEIARKANENPATDISPILSFLCREYAQLRQIMERSREEFLGARPKGGFRWRILLKVNELEMSPPFPFRDHLDHWEEILPGRFFILEQKPGPGRPRDRKGERKLIRRAYELVESPNSKFEPIDSGENYPPALLVQLKDEFEKELRYIKTTLDRYLFDLPIDLRHDVLTRP